MFNYYPKNFKANGWGWHRAANASNAVKGFLRGERGEGSEPLLENGSLYPKLPAEDDTVFSTGMKLYPALPAEEYESGAVEEVIEEACSAVNVNAVSFGYKSGNKPQPSDIG
ncbi:hypothetical protein HF086_007581 [Spodoptera exigua]|uniref:Uncharacterized protein n=1 Tax=Spodoptera exigua TaxID=7107 RepID=A0A922MTH8_SPOEX|nr:hypothetical protein HF086_007581 [Spodoptera exigua]